MDYLDTAKHRNIAANSDFGGLDGLVGFHIRLAGVAVYRHFSETFGDLGLTQKQVAVLWLLEDHPDLAQADIGRRLRMDRASVMAVVNRLQDHGFVKRSASTKDGRRQKLHLTEAGQAALVTARQHITEHELWLKERFTPAETAMLVELLRRIHL